MPDLNSLPPSRSITGAAPGSLVRALSNSGPREAEALRGQSPSPLSRSATTSLQATAAVNAGLRQEDSRRSSASSMTRNRQPSGTGRRRSTVLMNLQLNDPAVPAPGEMVTEGAAIRGSSPNSMASSPVIGSSGDPHHHFRTPSLGEIHQELEQEQEAQVNRLLQTIYVQQQELRQLQAARPGANTSAIADEPTPPLPSTERSSFSNPSPSLPHASSISTPRSPTVSSHPRTSLEYARADIQRRSRTPSRTASPRLRPSSVSAEAGDTWNLGGRDESAFYVAETQMLVRENQMLRQRIRELERQVTDSTTNAATTHEPATPSRLLRSTSISETGGLHTPAAGTEEAKEE